MNKMLLSLALAAATLTGCASYSSFDQFWGVASRNPFLALTGGKSLNHIIKWGYKNTYLKKLKGVPLEELRKRGLIIDETLADERLYQIYDSFYGYGSGTTTNTYAIYQNGTQDLLNSHYDGGAIYFGVWVETDDKGIIVDYREEGNNPHELPPRFRNKIADLIGEKPVTQSNTAMFLILNKSTGNWGLAVGDDFDGQGYELLLKAYASCVHKDTGIPMNKLKELKQIEAANEGGCKFATPSVDASAMAIFRNEMPDGSYEFHGAFSNTDTIPEKAYRKQEHDCQTEGKNCKLIGVFDKKDVGKVY